MRQLISALFLAGMLAIPVAGQAATKTSGTHPNCNPAKSKPCGNSCISLNKTCHK